MVEIKLLTTPGCSHCAKTKEILKKIKPDFPNLKVKEVDLTKHPEEVVKYRIMATPGIIINGKLEFSGGVTEEQLRKKLKEVKK